MNNLEKLKKYIDSYMMPKENKGDFLRKLEIPNIALAGNAKLKCNSSKPFEEPMAMMDFEACLDEETLDQFINKNKTENKFQKLLFSHIDEKNLKDSDVYNKVNIDRRLFSKIRSDVDYHPSKETVILLGISLELNLDQLLDLLDSASYSLPTNNVYDLIIRFCFEEKIYDLFEINRMLDEYKCKVL